MSEFRTASLQDLVRDAFRDMVDLAQKEVRLFKAEMAHNAGLIVRSVVMFAAAAVFAVASLIWLTQALVYGIDLFLHAPWLSALIVGGLLAIIAVALILVGRSWLSASTLSPDRTIRSLRHDGEMLSDKVVG